MSHRLEFEVGEAEACCRMCDQGLIGGYAGKVRIQEKLARREIRPG